MLQPIITLIHSYYSLCIYLNIKVLSLCFRENIIQYSRKLFSDNMIFISMKIKHFFCLEKDILFMEHFQVELSCCSD